MRPKLFSLLAVSAIALVGCSATETASVSEIATSPSPTAESKVKAKPLDLNPTSTASAAVDPVKAQQTKSYEEQTADFMSFIDPEFSGWAGDLPPESDLLAAAKLVCEQLRSGTPYDEVEAIKGAENNDVLAANNKKLVNAASSAYCLETRS